MSLLHPPPSNVNTAKPSALVPPDCRAYFPAAIPAPEATAFGPPSSGNSVLNRNVLLVGLSALALAACGSSNQMKLYPTAGPLAALTPPPVIKVTASNADGASGEITFRIPDGARCKGTWSTVAPRVTSRERGISLSIRDLGGRLGRTNETVAGVNNGEIYAVCRDGTIVQGSFVVGSGTTSGNGTATDSLGNSYKLLF